MLIQQEGQWQFESEQALESLLWEHLGDWFQWQAIARQQSLGGEYCDIIIRDDQTRFAIVELKNTEDRYVVQQLTRYYHQCREDPKIDSEIQNSDHIRLIAIAPTLHKHNFIDRIYHHLQVELWTFQIIQKQENLLLEFHCWPTPDQSLLIKQVEITNQILGSQLTIPDRLDHLDKSWQSILSAKSSTHGQILLDLRDRILNFHPEMQELATENTVTYGKIRKNKSLYQSEDYLSIRFERLQKSEFARVFVYLPAILKYAVKTLKLEINLSSDLKVISITVPSKCTSWFLNQFLNKDSPNPNNKYQLNSASYLEFYRAHMQLRYAVNSNYSDLQDLSTWIEIALEAWLCRMEQITRKQGNGARSLN